ncbi:MAG: DUF4034 domain-containing protein [Deltaproteobacteria bacterium]|nr:DUF4034 domain-containing protein [Deltaproteobacteria bacterium]
MEHKINRWVAVLLYFCLSVLTGVMVLGCDDFFFDKQASSGPMPPEPLQRGPRIAAKSIPLEPAFVGEEGVGAHGYPLRQPDEAALLNLLRLKRFDRLEQWMEYYQAEFEKDFRKEDWPDAMLSAFFVADPAIAPLLDQWVKRSPDHFAPFAARGNHRFKMAQHVRGGKFAKDTSQAQFRTMDVRHQAAAKDFQRAIALRPKLVAAHRRLVQMAESLPNKTERQLLDAGLAHCPLCFHLRVHYLRNITPRWGGSYKQMDAYVQEIQPLVKDNPKLAILAGFTHWDRCRTLREAKEPEQAAKACDAALAFGDHPHFLIEKAKLFDSKKQAAERLPWLDRALRLDPQERGALQKRFYARAKTKNYTGAALDLILARQLSPTNEILADNVKWLRDTLRFEGDQLYKAGQHKRALRLFSLGSQLDPDDNDLRYRAGWAQKQGGLITSEAELAAKPDDFELRLQRDNALAAKHKFGEVVKMWDTYIEGHPDDPRAYRERAGAKWQQGQRKEGVVDMQRACELGLNKACQDVPKMKRRM